MIDRIEQFATWIADRSTALMLLFSATFLSGAVLLARSRPVWFDEIYTIYICRLGSISDIVSALRNGLDLQPPLFFALTRASMSVVGDSPLGARLPALLGTALVILVLYRLVASSVSPIWGFAAVAFVLGTGLRDYVVEARPYGFLMGLCAVAVWFWVSRARGGGLLSALGLLVSMLLITSWHYYGFLIVCALGFAECVRTWETKRLDGFAWAAMILGLGPLALQYPLVQAGMRFYSGSAWNRPERFSLIYAYDLLFEDGKLAFFLFALVLFAISFLPRRPAMDGEQDAERRMPYWELALVVGIVALPLGGWILAVGVSKMMHWRYVLFTTFGLAWLFALIGDRLARRIANRTTLAGVCVTALLCASVLWQLQGDIRRKRVYARRPAPLVAAEQQHLPLVVGDGHTFAAWDYQFPDSRPTLASLNDTEVEAKMTGQNTMATSLLIAAPYFHIPVYDMKQFVAEHRVFLLAWEPGQYNWILPKLLGMGAHAQLLEVSGGMSLYRIDF